MKMKKFFPLLFLPLLFSCGETGTNKPATDTTSTTDNSFREEVLQLKHVGLLKSIPENNVDSLIKFYSLDSMNGLKEFLVKSGDMLKINADLNGGSPLDVYKNIFDTIAAHYPDLAASDFACKFLPNEPGGKDSGYVGIRCIINGHPYEKNMYYQPDWPVDEYLYKIFNSYLADISATDRLYLVQFNCKYCNLDNDYLGTLDVSRFGLMRLKKPIADSILYLEDLAMEPDDEFSIFTSAQTQQALQSLETTGLISKEMTQWNELKKQEVNGGFLYSMEDFYDFYDTLFCSASFDTLNDFNPYSDLLSNMAKVSRGKFNPQGISDQHATPVLHTLRFTLKGKVYEKDFEQHSELLDPSIIDEVNTALTKQKAGGKFYSVYSRESLTVLVFLTDAQLAQVKSSKFFPDLEEGAPQRLKIRFAQLPASVAM
jgi:hypothetical protein